MPSNTQKLLTDYHDASQRLEIRYGKEISETEKRILYHKLCTAARELVSRCVISDDPESLIFLLQELEALVRILGQSDAAKHIGIACHQLADYFRENGTFSLTSE